MEGRGLSDGQVELTQTVSEGIAAFECHDIAAQIIRKIDFEDISNIRATCRSLRVAVDQAVGQVKLECRLLPQGVCCDGCEPLLMLSRWPRVRRVVIRNATVVNVSCVTASVLKVWPYLQRLKYQFCLLDDNVEEENELDLSGYFALHAKQLRILEFFYSRISENTLNSILLVDMPNLRVVSLRGMGIETLPIGLSTRPSGIRKLEFVDNIRQPSSADEVVVQPIFSKVFDFSGLLKLDISCNILSPEDASIVFQQQKYPNLQRLKMSQCGLMYTHLDHLSTAFWPSLEHLDLSDNLLGTATDIGSLASLQAPRLKSLNVSAQRNSHPDALEGFTMSSWPLLEYLYLEDLSIGFIGIKGLASCRMNRLKLASFYNSSISADALTVFFTIHWPNIRKIDFGGNEHGVEVRRIVQCFANANYPKLEKVILTHSGRTSARSKTLDRKARIQLQQLLPQTRIEIEDLDR
eukprot:jgi/Picsp_1/648/NSC_00644-R1_---NA---